MKMEAIKKKKNKLLKLNLNINLVKNKMQKVMKKRQIRFFRQKKFLSKIWILEI